MPPSVGRDYPTALMQLLSRGANPRSLDREGRTPLMFHAEQKRIACVAQLLKDEGVRATVNMQVQAEQLKGSTALHLLCGMSKGVELSELLLGAGADATIRDGRGHTAEDIWGATYPNAEAALLLFPDAGPRCWCMPGGWWRPPRMPCLWHSRPPKHEVGKGRHCDAWS